MRNGGAANKKLAAAALLVGNSGGGHERADRPKCRCARRRESPTKRRERAPPSEERLLQRLYGQIAVARGENRVDENVAVGGERRETANCNMKIGVYAPKDGNVTIIVCQMRVASLQMANAHVHADIVDLNVQNVCRLARHLSPIIAYRLDAHNSRRTKRSAAQNKNAFADARRFGGHKPQTLAVTTRVDVDEVASGELERFAGCSLNASVKRRFGWLSVQKHDDRRVRDLEDDKQIAQAAFADRPNGQPPSPLTNEPSIEATRSPTRSSSIRFAPVGVSTSISPLKHWSDEKTLFMLAPLPPEQ